MSATDFSQTYVFYSLLEIDAIQYITRYTYLKFVMVMVSVSVSDKLVGVGVRTWPGVEGNTSLFSISSVG